MPNDKPAIRQMTAALIAGGLVAGAAACTRDAGTAAPTAAPLPGIQMTSLMPDVRAFEQAAAGRDKAEQVQLFKEMVIAKHGQIYGPVVPAPSDAAVGRLVEQLPALSRAMRRIEPAITRTVAEVAPRIAAFLASDAPPPPVYLMPSFFGFDGQVRPAGNGVAVMFGIDAIAANAAETGRQDTAPLVAHEFFHAWHFQTNQPLAEAAKGYFVPGGTPPLYASLWFEGLATCVSRMVNPDAALEDVLLSSTLATLPAADTRRIAGQMLAKLDSRSMEDAALYLFRGGPAASAVPERVGYLVGMLVADAVLRQTPATQAAMLSDAPLRRAVEGALQALQAGTLPPDARQACRIER